MHLKLHDEESFFVSPYAIKEEQKPVKEKEMNCTGKQQIIKMRPIGYSCPVFLVKKNTNICT